MLKQIDQFSSLLDGVEAKREQSDNVEGLRSLQKRVNGSAVNFTRPGRKLLKKGKVVVVDSVRSKPKERLLVLTNDLLVVLREKRTMSKRNLYVINAIPLASADLNDISIVGQEHSFMVYTQDRVGIFSTYTKYDKFDWMRLLQECLNGHYKETTHFITPSSFTIEEKEEKGKENVAEDNLDDLESDSSSSSLPSTPKDSQFTPPINTIEVTLLTT